jgi:hypothetical protein
MAEYNRYYRPSRGQYQSQFVPTKLPIDLMAKQLYGKQARADQMMQAAIKLGDWEQEALGWHDKEYVKGIKNEIQDFAARSMTEDRTSPEFQRRYLELTNRIKNDENLKKVANAVAINKEYQENIAKLKSSNPDQAEILEADYLYRLNEYTKEGGKGFEGMTLGDQNILKGVNEFKAGLEFFSPLKDSGGDSIKFLDSGISYKKGWTGISDKRVEQQAERQYNLFKDTRAGHQLWLKELAKEGLVETTFNQLSAADKKKIREVADRNMRNEFLDIGRSVVHGVSSSNLDAALNAQRTEDMENEVVIAPTSERPYSKLTKTGAQTQINDLKKKENDIWNLLWKDKKRMEDGLSSAYTDEEKAQMRRQANIYKKQGNELGNLMNQTFDNIQQAQIKKITPELEQLFKGQEYHWNKLKGLVDDATFKRITDRISAKSTFFSPDNMRGDVSNPEILRTIYKLLPEGGEAIKALKNIVYLEDKKLALRDQVDNKTRELYAKTEDLTDKEGEYVIQPSGATVRTDEHSTMAAFDNMVTTNSETVTLRDSKGNPIDISVYGPDARINKFSGNSVTSSGSAHHSGMSVDGFAEIIVQETIDGVKQVNKDGSPKYKTMKVAVNATLEGENSQFFKDNWAREQAEMANLKTRQGKYEEARVARTHAMQLNNNSVQQELVNFEASSLTRLPVQVSTFAADGTYTGQTSVMVTKIGEGGRYTISVGGVKETVGSMNEANARIQEITNSRISN